MNYEVVSRNVDLWIDEMELPVRANLKPIRMFSELVYEDEDEQEAWSEVIHWNLTREHEILKLIPMDEYRRDFWAMELDEDGHDISAFNTIDFHRTYGKGFSLYQWQLKKLCETVKHMAIDFSIFTDDVVKKKLKARVFEFIRTKGKGHRATLCRVWLDYAYWK